VNVLEVKKTMKVVTNFVKDVKERTSAQEIVKDLVQGDVKKDVVVNAVAAKKVVKKRNLDEQTVKEREIANVKQEGW
jgi:hypothetical protein